MSPLILLSLSMTDAQAFAPPGEVYVGVEPSRVVRAWPARQAELKSSMTWSRFEQGDGAGWQVVFDEKAGTVLKTWGPGIELGGLESDQDVEQALRAVFARNPVLAGVGGDSLQLRDIGYVERTDTWYVGFDRLVQTADGDLAPIWRGGVEARIVQGRLVMVGVKTHPGATVGTVQVSAEQATRTSIDQGPLPFAKHSLEDARLVVLPVEEGSGLAYRLCWETHTRTKEGPGIWTSLIDAETGELVTVWNEVRFFDGHVSIEHDERNPNSSLIVSPAPLAPVSDAYTDLFGAFTAEPQEGSFSTSLNGSYVRVRNSGGPNAAATFGEEDFTWTADTADIAERDSYIFLHQIKAWGEIYGPEADIVWDRITSTVNMSDVCNAYYDGDVNFFSAGSGCNNTGRLADVNYHEWGHGFHYTSLLSGSFDGSISEGIGDVTAFLLTGDPIVAPYFMTNGSGIRRVDTDRVYPQDVTGEVHADGLIFAGAVWDLWAVMAGEYGEEDGYDLTASLFALGIKGGPTIPESYDEFVVADDDDGDLGNGTPHTCQLIDAFQPHGLGPGSSAGSLLELGHVPVENHDLSATAYELSAEVSNLAPSCIDFAIAEASVSWSIDGGRSWDSAALDFDADRVWGSIPAQEQGTIVEYYLSVEAEGGDLLLSPSGGSINPHSFLAGDFDQLYFEDFEGPDGGGYTHALIDGKDELGADDWQLGTPRGAATDPDFAFSGDKVWGNDLGEGNYNGEYQNDKHNRLSSVEIEVPEHSRVFLQYRRWLGVEDGYYDEARVLVDEEVFWTNHGTNQDLGTEHHVDKQWALHTLEIEDLDGDGVVVIGWDIVSDGGLAFGGWNIDDVAIYTWDQGADPDLDTGTTDLTPGDELEIAPACGCASTRPGGAGLAAMLLGLLVLRRRR